MCPGQDLVAPGDDGVDDVMELAELAGGVEVGEPVERFEGGVAWGCPGLTDTYLVGHVPGVECPCQNHE